VSAAAHTSHRTANERLPTRSCPIPAAVLHRSFHPERKIVNRSCTAPFKPILTCAAVQQGTSRSWKQRQTARLLCQAPRCRLIDPFQKPNTGRHPATAADTKPMSMQFERPPNLVHGDRYHPRGEPYRGRGRPEDQHHLRDPSQRRHGHCPHPLRAPARPAVTQQPPPGQRG
jgi:hypothetical protein